MEGEEQRTEKAKALCRSPALAVLCQRENNLLSALSVLQKITTFVTLESVFLFSCWLLFDFCLFSFMSDPFGVQSYAILQKHWAD